MEEGNIEASDDGDSTWVGGEREETRKGLVNATRSKTPEQSTL